MHSIKTSLDEISVDNTRPSSSGAHNESASHATSNSPKSKDEFASSQGTHSTRLLFFAHAVTMAHLVRPLRCIEVLDRNKYDIWIATDERYKALILQSNASFAKFITLHCIDPVTFGEIVDRANIIYTKETLVQHVKEDIDIMEEVRPDIVIGDFRHSLSISCRKLGIKYLNITNSYWSMGCKVRFPIPESPVVRALSVQFFKLLPNFFMDFLINFNFRKMLKHMAPLFKEVGISYHDYREVITDGDLALFCDTETLVPLSKPRSHERYIGPIVWSMPVALPDWWDQLSSNRKKVFVALGSSGRYEILPMIIKTLAQMDLEIIVASGGNEIDVSAYQNVFVTDFLPIEDVCRKVDVMVNNGGSPMTHAGLMFGVPSVGIICNNDQLLNMAHLEALHVGKMLRYWNVQPKPLRRAVQEVLNNPRYSQGAKAHALEFSACDLAASLESAFAEVMTLQKD